jgi:hypothetical protein
VVADITATMADKTNTKRFLASAKRYLIVRCQDAFLTHEELNDMKLKGTDGVEVPANHFLLTAPSQLY